MVQAQSQAKAPAKTVQTFDGLIMAKICTPEHGCVMTQVMAHMRIDDDDSWFVAYYDPNDPMRNVSASGSDERQSGSLSGMLNAIASLAPTQP